MTVLTESEKALAAAAEGKVLYATNRRRRLPGAFHSSTLSSLYRKGLLRRYYSRGRGRYVYTSLDHRVPVLDRW